ncbi:MAG: LptF/LptG family permease [bacterium]|nr:LptF/LptG family permease [bacterium]
MNKTLFRYIGVDLLKITGLTLIVLTLTLSMLGIIEPLRKQGLDARLAALLFTMSLPVMLSLTLPFAALFAACFVYGRFSQDNELLASRASGISIFTLLWPAAVLGLTVTLVSWTLSNNIAPVMAKRGTEMIMNNVRGAMCRKLQLRGFLGFQDMTIHADRVHEYPDKDYDKLEGAIVIKRLKKDKHVEIYSAKSARARFGINPDTKKAFVSITLDKAIVMSSANGSVQMQDTFPIENLGFNRRIKEKPAWYSLTELLDTLADPSKSITVKQAIAKIQQDIRSDIFARHIAEAFKTDGAYNKFVKHNERFVIKAPNILLGNPGRVSLSASGAENAQLVEITVLRDGKAVKKATAATGRIQITWNKFTGVPEVSITLINARMTNLLRTDEDPTGIINAPTTKSVWAKGGLQIPKSIQKKMDGITPHEAYHNGGPDGGLTDNPTIHANLAAINGDQVVRLRRDIISEMNMRLAYSLSCLLMVVLGAMLGLIFRGGQFVSALVTTTAPAVAVIVTILMGKNVAQNPDIMSNSPDASIYMGISIIWGGITLLAVATSLTYWKLSRK